MHAESQDEVRDVVEVYVDHEQEFRWRHKAGNGETIADSGEGYYGFQDALLMAARQAPQGGTLRLPTARYRIGKAARPIISDKDLSITYADPAGTPADPAGTPDAPDPSNEPDKPSDPSHLA